MRASVPIFLIATMMVQSGLAIRCYSCDSESNPNCANMTDYNLVPEECNFERQIAFELDLKSQNSYNSYNYKYNYQPRHWLLRLSDLSERNFNFELNPKFVCQKLVGTDEHKHVTIVRRCQVDYEEPCEFKRDLTTNLNRNVECYLCAEDGCNGSTNNSVFGMLIAIVSAVAVFKHFIC